ncbi:hypothetical protein PFISCL1PPCAC_19358 [Pristionchus fissidentatus]|uniref:Cyclin-like domain-containing protein n=1 Tax=Pristionchus fissidentatus TaxID=1538716 RepID=A0AAV5W895_9BILA|nr:hypothetical protein PFISCL1PPCAC_19358 [Pristionchus fissidentatus]
MSSSSAAPTPWDRKSTAQGRRRVSLRLRDRSTFVVQSTPDLVSSACEREDRGQKRVQTCVESGAKRMRLLSDCEEEEGSSMGEEVREHDESIEGREEDEEEHGGIDPPMMVSSSMSSSDDDAQSLNGGHMDMSRSFDDEEEEEEIDDEDDYEVDKTDIITSDEGEDLECESEMRFNEPTDPLERMKKFRQLSRDLEQRFEMMPMKEPNQLTARCHGVGPASEVWSVLCHKDELHSICNPNFMNVNDPHRSINGLARATLIDWMQEVCFAEKLHRETFHLAIDYVDRFMNKEGLDVKISAYQLLGTTALFLAAKYEEIYPPKVEDVVAYTDHACSVGQVRQLEMLMLSALEWELNVITPLHWAHLFLELLTGNAKPSSSRIADLLQSDGGHYVEGPKESDELPATTGTCMRDEYMHLAYVMDIVILHESCRRFSNRVVAAAVLYTTYDATEAIQQVTGLSPMESPMKEAIEWVEPIVVYCEKQKHPHAKMPVMEGIRADAVHTIQLHRTEVSITKKVDEVMHDIVRLRQELLQYKDILRPNTGNTTPHSRPAAIRLRK